MSFTPIPHSIEPLRSSHKHWPCSFSWPRSLPSKLRLYLWGFKRHAKARGKTEMSAQWKKKSLNKIDKKKLHPLYPQCTPRFIDWMGELMMMMIHFRLRIRIGEKKKPAPPVENPPHILIFLPAPPFPDRLICQLGPMPGFGRKKQIKKMSREGFGLAEQAFFSKQSTCIRGKRDRESRSGELQGFATEKD